MAAHQIRVLLDLDIPTWDEHEDPAELERILRERLDEIGWGIHIADLAIVDVTVRAKAAAA